MDTPQSYEVIIIGGGLAGLCSAIQLATTGIKVLLFEKHQYPHHKVCGEYVSNEVLPYLAQLGIDPFEIGAHRISKFKITNVNGKVLETKLPMGGFGISRYALDDLIFKSLPLNAEVKYETVESIEYDAGYFEVSTKDKYKYRAKLVIGAYGKRSNVDTFLNRKFITQKSPWLAVKAHYDYEIEEGTVALHNFPGGYCGLSKTETGAVNACYLARLATFKKIGDIDKFQDIIMSQNVYLKHFFTNARCIFEKPLTISQVSFQEKNVAENGIFMVGDSAGLIHPLCGNGMAMAIQGAKILSGLIIDNISKWDSEKIISEYKIKWNDTFGARMKYGKWLQHILLSKTATTVGFKLAETFPSILTTLITKTHGSQWEK